MKCNKKFLAVAAAGALTAATAVPALALENEFHGAFTTFYDLSNYTSVGNNPWNVPATNAAGLQDDAPTSNYFVQRVRLGYNAKASDNVKLVTKFELDYNFWGNSSYSVARGSGGAIGSDSVNIETKTLYLDLNYPKYVNAKIGMMGNTDSFKGILFDADMAGLIFSHDYSNAGVTAGFFRWNDTSTTTLGKTTTDLFQLDGRYSVTKDVKVGAAYYYIEDDMVGAEVHNVGISAEGIVGPVRLNGFALKQFGDLTATEDADGYAFNLGARVPLGGGTLRSEFLYVSGGDEAFYNAAGGTEAGGYYDSEMVILGRDKNATTIDNAIIYDVSNYGQGVIMGAVGYDYPISSKLSASANAGFAAIADDENATVTSGSSDYLGTEVNAEVNYQLTDNVTLGARGAYVFLGDYFEGLDADDPYDMKVLVRYVF